MITKTKPKKNFKKILLRFIFIFYSLYIIVIIIWSIGVHSPDQLFTWICTLFFSVPFFLFLDIWAPLSDIPRQVMVTCLTSCGHVGATPTSHHVGTTQTNCGHVGTTQTSHGWVPPRQVVVTWVPPWQVVVMGQTSCGHVGTTQTSRHRPDKLWSCGCHPDKSWLGTTQTSCGHVGTTTTQTSHGHGLDKLWSCGYHPDKSWSRGYHHHPDKSWSWARQVVVMWVPPRQVVVTWAPPPPRQVMVMG